MSVASDRPIAPYAPAANVLAVIRRLHDKAIPVPVTKENLTVLGIPEGNAPRTLQALKLLGIVAEDGQLLEPAEMLRRASQEEYPETLAEILREAYAPVFKVVDPSSDTDVRVSDAFRQYDPATQRGRMVTLFLALCAEAGIVDDRPARTAPRPRRESRPPRRNSVRTNPDPNYVPLAAQLGRVQSPLASPIFSISEEDLTLLDPDQRKRLWDALGELMLARATARSRPAPSPFPFIFGPGARRETEKTEGE